MALTDPKSRTVFHDVHSGGQPRHHGVRFELGCTGSPTGAGAGHPCSGPFQQGGPHNIGRGRIAGKGSRGEIGSKFRNGLPSAFHASTQTRHAAAALFVHRRHPAGKLSLLRNLPKREIASSGFRSSGIESWLIIVQL
jgi:hypothetical protein